MEAAEDTIVGQNEVTPVLGSLVQTLMMSSQVKFGFEKSTPNAPLNCKSMNPGDRICPAQSITILQTSSFASAACQNRFAYIIKWDCKKSDKSTRHDSKWAE